MARRLTTHFFVAYEVRGEKLSPDRCNPLLARFKKMLEDFRVEKGDFKAFVEVVDDFLYEEVDTRFIKISSHLKFEVIDSSPSIDVNLYALDDVSRADIHNKLRELCLSDGTYSHKVDLRVVDSHEGSEPPMSRENSVWPKQRF